MRHRRIAWRRGVLLDRSMSRARPDRSRKGDRARAIAQAASKELRQRGGPMRARRLAVGLEPGSTTAAGSWAASPSIAGVARELGLGAPLGILLVERSSPSLGAGGVAGRAPAREPPRPGIPFRVRGPRRASRAPPARALYGSATPLQDGTVSGPGAGRPIRAVRPWLRPHVLPPVCPSPRPRGDRRWPAPPRTCPTCALHP